MIDEAFSNKKTVTQRLNDRLNKLDPGREKRHAELLALQKKLHQEKQEKQEKARDED